MHSLYFVKLKEERATAPEEAIAEAQDVLDSNGFAGEHGYFGACKCDWYSVGGRWSGQLQQAQLGIEFSVELREALPPDRANDYTVTFLQEHDAEAQAVWERLGGKGRHPYGRDAYMRHSSDDAAHITPEMLKAFREKDEYRHVEVFDGDDLYEEYVRD